MSNIVMQKVCEPSPAVPGSVSVLDACCGSRMFWFDRKDPRVTFVDKRKESHVLPDKSSAGGSRKLVIDPDIRCRCRLSMENRKFRF